MADIARILTEVLLQADKAIATWKVFGDAAVKEFNRINKSAAHATAQVDKSLRRMHHSLNRTGREVAALGTKIRQVGQVVSVGLGAPVLLFARQAINSFKSAQESLTRLKSQFDNTGKAAGQNMEEMLGFAETVQKTLTFSDEAVMDMQATLLKFTNIGGKQFKELRQIILDFAATTGTDLPEAAQLFGMALNDPTKAMRALRQAGIALTEEENDLIKAWVEGGQAAKAQDFLLKKLGKTYKDAAKNFAATDLGKNIQAWNLLDDALEQVGARLLTFETQIVQFATRVITTFNELPEGLKDFITWIGIAAAAIGPFLFILGGLIWTFGQILKPIGLLIRGFKYLGGGAFRLGTAFGYILRAVAFVATALTGAAFWPIIIGLALAAIVVLVYVYWDEIVAAFNQGVEWVADVLNGWIASMNETLAGWGASIVEMWNGIWQMVADTLNGWIAAINDKIASMGQAFTEAWNNGIERMKAAWTSFTSWIQSSIDSMKAWLADLWEDAKSTAAKIKDAVTKAKAPAPAAGGGGGGGGHARGGQIYGRGGVDNVAAWLSAGEWVHRVAAVRKYGAGFMSAVNSLTFPTALARGYNGGGFVGGPRMAYARGGAVAGAMGQGTPFTLVIDGSSFDGLRAPADTAADLVRFSRERQLRSTGRAPSWFR